MVLERILRELDQTSGPVCLNDLSRKLGVELDALEGMVSFLERRGRLKRVSGVTSTVCSTLSAEMANSASCATQCPGVQRCPVLAKPVLTSDSPPDDP
jgi:hypothetical protein